MNRFVKEHLEEYLSGRLGGERLEQFERRLEQDPRSAAELAAMIDNASLFEAFDLPAGELSPVPSPGFYARVRRQIAEEEKTPFWEVFLEPFILRRVAVAACVWLFAVGAATLYRGGEPARSHMAESILAKPPAVADYYVRLGSDLDMNRDTMLSAVLAPSR